MSKLLPKFDDLEDAEDFVGRWFDRLLWGLVIGISIIWIPILWPLIVGGNDPYWWTLLEKLLQITW